MRNTHPLTDDLLWRRRVRMRTENAALTAAEDAAPERGALTAAHDGPCLLGRPQQTSTQFCSVGGATTENCY